MAAPRISRRSVGLIVFFCIAVFLIWWRFFARISTPRVEAAIVRLHDSASVPQTASKGQPIATTRSRAPTGHAFNPIAVSSFIASEHIAGLSDEQLARLELLLQAARRETYRLMVERGQTSPLPAGYEIEIPAQGELSALKRHIYQSIEEIVGTERMSDLEENALGPRFDAKFAYFGAYPTTIKLTFDNAETAARRGPRDILTIQSQYRKVAFPGFSNGRIASTSVLYFADFERDFFELSSLAPKG